MRELDQALRDALGRPRLGVNMTVSGEMMVALWHLAERNGIGATTQAKVLLRQALSRTIATPEVQADVAEYKAYRTNRQWRIEQAEAAEMMKYADKCEE